MQFQTDQQLYERLFSESMLYFYRNGSRFCDWQAVVIYPSRRVEQTRQHPHRSLLHGEQVHRIYLDELGEIRELPITVASVVLTIVEEAQAPEEARYLLLRTEQAALTPQAKRDIIDVVTAIMAYKFSTLSQTEIKAMLGLNLFEEPRAIREAKDEGRQEAIASVAIRLLTRQFKQELSEEMRSRITSLPLPVLENLSEALLDFTNVSDLETWLAQNA
ncbi:DUF2887 domain-containing protein [Gloeocapsopsis crepidinum]|uniref:DUF2887 domain-containing protein n=1 Tax=Gloeocapsopsis crepidinum TaxID=693223 RepID=UPI002AD3BDAD|nr:DUF2887 domain-containing protein [Gloeocapsopsis crepidinum]